MQKDLAIPTNFDHDFWEDKIVLTDSRQMQIQPNMVFFAIQGANYDGAQFISDLYHRGIRYFVSHRSPSNKAHFPEALFLEIEQPIRFLQAWAQAHRAKFDLEVIGITGSNGKTIVKEYLYQLLAPEYKLVKSPKSYNSQLGVPLSVLQIRAHHQLGIFEAGISQPKEMQYIAPIIAPSIGIFTNIGAAHDIGFSSKAEKIKEKLLLFKNSQQIIYQSTDNDIHYWVQKYYPEKELWSWGATANAKIPIKLLTQQQHKSVYQIKWQSRMHLLTLPFADHASIQNSLHAVVCLLLLGYDLNSIKNRLERLQNIPMRLAWKTGVNACMLIDDSYNNDLAGLQIALDFMQKKSTAQTLNRKTLILSDIAESALSESACYEKVAKLVQDYHITKFIGIGKALTRQRALFSSLAESHFFEQTSECLKAIGETLDFYKETILLKGARVFQFEQLARKLSRHRHKTILEFDLNALAHNYNSYKALLKNNTKIMVMVKAFAYGSSSYEIAHLLVAKGIDYLGVAYTDEAVQLRLQGIQIPIMVMNPNIDDFQDLIEYKLEPAIYSLDLIRALALYAKETAPAQTIRLQIEFDSGMNRLGLKMNELDELIPLLNQSYFEIAGLFSHLAAADEMIHTDFSKKQISLFQQFATVIETKFRKSFVKHILNSAGITRFPEAQFDMVRLGIGLHGIDPNTVIKGLKPIAKLRTIISQVKIVLAGESIGYGRASISDKDRKIATLAIGYADGFSRAFSKGVGCVWIKGQFCPIVGNICMDMCFVDVSHLDVQAGEEVIIFGKEQPIQKLAQAIHTIPYEILTNISRRVPRIFYDA